MFGRKHRGAHPLDGARPGELLEHALDRAARAAGLAQERGERETDETARSKSRAGDHQGPAALERHERPAHHDGAATHGHGRQTQKRKNPTHHRALSKIEPRPKIGIGEASSSMARRAKAYPLLAASVPPWPGRYCQK